MRREAPQQKIKPARSSAKSATTPAADLPASAAPDFERLRAWRAATAKEQGVPAYVIFHDATLKAIATLRPATLAQLGSVSGVGQSKLTKFGQQVLDLFENSPGPTTPPTAPASTPATARPATPAPPTTPARPATSAPPAAPPRSDFSRFGDAAPTAPRQRTTDEPLFFTDEEPPDEEPPYDPDYDY
jgi:ATP-dependent DNA helicase RecQ